MLLSLKKNSHKNYSIISLNFFAAGLYLLLQKIFRCVSRTFPQN